MSRRAFAIFVVFGSCAVALAVSAPAAWADRPLSDITCVHGDRATYDRGAHRFSDNAVVLGCARLTDSGVAQIDAGPQPGESSPTCLWLTIGPPRADGIFACAHRLGSEPRVLLILRDRSPKPLLVMGVAPATAERVLVAYSSRKGARERVRAQTIRAGDRLAQRVGAAEAFRTFVAELGPGVDVCEGIVPRAPGPARFASHGRAAVPRGHPLGRPDGWLAGFALSYGIGYGPDGAPNVCGRPSGAESRHGEPPALELRGALDVLGALTKLLSMVSATGPWTG
jgi:hypothetical protein